MFKNKPRSHVGKMIIHHNHQLPVLCTLYSMLHGIWSGLEASAQRSNPALSRGRSRLYCCRSVNSLRRTGCLARVSARQLSARRLLPPSSVYFDPSSARNVQPYSLDAFLNGLRQRVLFSKVTSTSLRAPSQTSPTINKGVNAANDVRIFILSEKSLQIFHFIIHIRGGTICL